MNPPAFVKNCRTDVARVPGCCRGCVDLLVSVEVQGGKVSRDLLLSWAKKELDRAAAEAKAGNIIAGKVVPTDDPRLVKLEYRFKAA